MPASPPTGAACPSVRTESALIFLAPRPTPSVLPLLLPRCRGGGGGGAMLSRLMRRTGPAGGASVPDRLGGRAVLVLLASDSPRSRPPPRTDVCRAGGGGGGDSLLCCPGGPTEVASLADLVAPAVLGASATLPAGDDAHARPRSVSDDSGGLGADEKDGAEGEANEPVDGRDA